MQVELNAASIVCGARLFGGGRVLGDGLGALRHGVLGEFTWQDEADTEKSKSVDAMWVDDKGDSRGLNLAR